MMGERGPLGFTLGDFYIARLSKEENGSFITGLALKGHIVNVLVLVI